MQLDRYAQDGVNVVAGDTFSSIVGKKVATTYFNCPYIEVLDLSKGNFRGPRPFRVKGDFLFDAGPDGVGTKVFIHDALMTHPFAARDLLAMTIGDITRFGGLPAVFWNVLDPHSIGEPGTPRFELFIRTIDELVAAGNEQGVVIHKGETAELGPCVGSFDNAGGNAPFNWSGVALGLFREDKIIYGDQVEAGDVVVALREEGFRSNGISSVRKAFEIQYGPDFYRNSLARNDLMLAARPSALYDKFLTTANGWYEASLQPLIDVRLIAHITGGGIGKFVELLKPSGLSAVLDDLFDLPAIMRKCADWRGMTDREVYTTWNGGQGVLAVIPPHQVDAFRRLARQFGIEARVCGRIEDSKQTTVTVSSKYKKYKAHYKREKLVFAAE